MTLDITKEQKEEAIIYRCCCVCKKIEIPYLSFKMYEEKEVIGKIDLNKLSHTYLSKECCETQPDYLIMKTLDSFQKLPIRCENGK